jgi:hypothetical protein
VGILVAKAKARAAKRDYPFDLAPEDLFPLPSHCPVLGIELDYGLKGVARANGNSASLDRLDPIKGYTKGNVIVISNRANTLKNNGTATEHLAIAEYITRNTP